MTNTSATYRPAQIWLHWIVVVGVIIQIAFHDPIVAVIDALQEGQTPTDADMTSAMVHVSVGSIILLAVIGRLALLWRYGKPGHPPGTTALQGRIADVMHIALYGMLLGMVVTGMLTWNGIAPLGGVHFGINVALFFAALAHGLAALFNQFVRKDGTLARMIPALRK